ncbi:pentatricopeptide repeat-containing protein [Tripterygium wilfordii]|uniref:Pentatricopeptide repeat-containing protein n=1 Tax=Tripterygium wilfordii TaxID=458696 RepID=A0A7J7D8U2_TRIWF|nr:pentatricopeptide repeat-containing protein [Tripterygium wilfordii]
MGSLKLHFSQLGFHQNLHMIRYSPPSPIASSARTTKTRSLQICCGLRRAGARKPLWRSRVLTTEAIQAVQSLKLARSSHKLEDVFNSRISRLLKADLLDTLAELKRQNEVDLALKVFEYVRKEVWYEPDQSLYCNMIQMLGENKLIELAEELFSELEKEGLKPDTRAFTEMIGVYINLGMIEKAVERYGAMKMSGCVPDKLTFAILIRGLEKAGKEDLAATVKKECDEYLEDPEKFLKEIERKYVRKLF